MRSKKFKQQVIKKRIKNQFEQAQSVMNNKKVIAYTSEHFCCHKIDNMNYMFCKTEQANNVLYRNL